MKKNSGFSLIELAIVILLCGFLLSIFLNIVPVFIKSYKVYFNQKRMQTVENAINAFVLKNKRLPYPARINKHIDNDIAQYGVEEGNIANLKSVGNLLIGAIPSATLKLNMEYTTDAYGNKFVYIMNKNCGVSIKNCDTETANLITVRYDNASNSVDVDDNIYTIISNGFDKAGAYTIYGNLAISKIIPTRNTYSTINSNIVYYYNNDDKMIFKTRDLLNMEILYNIDCELSGFNTESTCEGNLFSLPESIKYREKKVLGTYYITVDGTGIVKTKHCVVECANFGNAFIYSDLIEQNE